MKVFCNWPEARVVMALGIELKPGVNEVADVLASDVLALDGVKAAPVVAVAKEERGARKGSPEKE